MKNISLKTLIVGSLIALALLGVAGGVYIWTSNTLKVDTSVEDSTASKDDGSAVEAATAKTESATTVEITTDMLDANGNIIPSKVR